MIGVSAMGRLSFRKDTGDFFGTDMIVVDLRHVGMTAVCPCIFAVCEVIIDFLCIWPFHIFDATWQIASCCFEGCFISWSESFISGL